MSVLLDTNLLLALVFPRDKNHARARLAMREITVNRIIAAPVLPELFYLISERVNYPAAVKFFNILKGGAYQIEPVSDKDMARMHEIMTEYQDNAFDFVDTAIMALAERLNIDTIYTLDRRDFGAFRPRHCKYFNLLP